MQIGNIIVTDYSPKSIAVQGETIKYKDIFKGLGGHWNRYLKGGPGWIFTIKKKHLIVSRLRELESK